MLDMKNELLQNIRTSMATLEKEVTTMRSELANIKNLGKVSDGE